MYQQRYKTRSSDFVSSLSENYLIQQGVSDLENSTTVCIFIQVWIALLQNSPLVDIGGQKPLKTYMQFNRELLTRPIRDSILQYTSYFEDLMGVGVETPPIENRDRSQTGPFLWQMKNTPVFKEYIYWWKTGDPDVLQYLMSFLSFGRKLSYIDDALHEVALRDWESTEELFDTLTFNGKTVEQLRRILDVLMPGEDHGLISNHMKHGPGSTSEGVRGIVEKCLTSNIHPRIKSAFLDDNKYNMSYMENKAHQVENTFFEPLCSEESLDTSRLVFVFKTVKSARTICLIPISFMLAQQALMWLMVSEIDIGYASNFIDLENQDNNRNGAKYGSKTGYADTIDLSRASDSVSNELVHMIFPERIKFFMRASRTSAVELPDGSFRKVKKYAPMGSATCFPTQCLIFLSAILLAYLRYSCEDSGFNIDEVLTSSTEIQFHLNRIISDRSSNRKLFKPIVYGDDLLVDYRVTPSLVPVLSELGFTVNTEKSFVHHDTFRESCGGYYWLGYDVTPTIFKCKPIGKHWDAESLESAVQLTNRIGDAGYIKAQSVMISYITKLLPMQGVYKRDMGRIGTNPIRFTSEREDDSCAIYSKEPHNNHLKIRTYEPTTVQPNAPRLENMKDYRRFISRSTNHNLGSSVLYQRDEVKSVSIKTAGASKIRATCETEREYVDAYHYMLTTQSQTQYNWVQCDDYGRTPEEITLQGRSYHDKNGRKIVVDWTPRRS